MKKGYLSPNSVQSALVGASLAVLRGRGWRGRGRRGSGRRIAGSRVLFRVLAYVARPLRGRQQRRIFRYALPVRTYEADRVILPCEAIGSLIPQVI
jgi:hypothetical protein